MKKPFDFAYGFKSRCTSINERFYKLEGFIHSRPNNNINTFPPFCNKFLPLLRTFSLTGFPILYPLKQKDICDYDPRCIISNGLMFDDIIMNILNNNKSEFHNEEDDWSFLQILKTASFIFTGVYFNTFTGKKELTSV